jgi:hypothetical protein
VYCGFRDLAVAVAVDHIVIHGSPLQQSGLDLNALADNCRPQQLVWAEGAKASGLSQKSHHESGRDDGRAANAAMGDLRELVGQAQDAGVLVVVKSVVTMPYWPKGWPFGPIPKHASLQLRVRFLIFDIDIPIDIWNKT